MRKLGLYFAGVCVAVSLLILMPSSHGQAANHGIAGTWVITVTVNTTPLFVFTDIIALNSGGTLTGASSAFNVSGCSHTERRFSIKENNHETNR